MLVLQSIFVWLACTVAVLIWLPLLALVRLFDRDAAHYRTGRFFRLIGVLICKVNPAWKLTISGVKINNPRNPFIVVSNHQSFADIPLISNLPWEMKWVAKIELFRAPIFGWMLKLAGDIPVDRKNKQSRADVLPKAAFYLKKHCSVMFFPEGTRSPDSRVHKFADGAFRLAIEHQLPILPLAVDGSSNCLPKHSIKFGRADNIRLKVLTPIETKGLTEKDATDLRDQVRHLIMSQIAEWRKVSVSEVDGLIATP
ncbi:MAG: lysophospholipid acyltransferase family protein [Chloroherpetonaceae bacterium]|nr:lysophospholipid acyltransferase family protein [Chloroherpetonaceae bacterium]